MEKEITAREAAGILSELADLMEIKGDNRYRIRAYQNAARSLSSVSEELKVLVAEDRLTEIKGIGEGLSATIKEIFATGTADQLEELKRELPAGLLDLIEVPGVGPKRAHQLYYQLEVSGVEDLKKALQEKRVRELEGFGPKLAKNLKEAVARYESFQERMKINEADCLAGRIGEHLERKPELYLKYTTAGSLRRRKELVKDIDILMIPADPESDGLENHLRELEGLHKVESAGSSKITLVLESGVKVDFRLVAEDEFPAALIYFTGSKEHNVKLRQLAKEKGYFLNEYGLFSRENRENREDSEGREDFAERGDSGENEDLKDPEDGEYREDMDLSESSRGGNLGKKSEGDAASGFSSEGDESAESGIYHFFGLDFIEPELREDRGEIEAARKGELPDLIDFSDIRGDFHLHTRYSDGAYGIEDMAVAARELGYEYLAVTDHSKSLRIASGLSEERLREQLEEIGRLKDRISGIRILSGIEVDILPDGGLDFSDDILRRLDLVIASIHSGFNQSREENTGRLVEACRNPEVDIIGHPRGRLLGRRDAYRVEMAEVIEAAAETGTCLEINASPSRLDLDDLLARQAASRGVRLAISTDAHHTGELSDMRLGADVARRAWLEKQNVLNALPLDDLLEFLA